MLPPQLNDPEFVFDPGKLLSSRAHFGCLLILPILNKYARDGECSQKP